ncbi:unnamed protein product [Sympodiomycopsis kandeliae]
MHRVTALLIVSTWGSLALGADLGSSYSDRTCSKDNAHSFTTTASCYIFDPRIDAIRLADNVSGYVFADQSCQVNPLEAKSGDCTFYFDDQIGCVTF